MNFIEKQNSSIEYTYLSYKLFSSIIDLLNRSFKLGIIGGVK